MPRAEVTIKTRDGNCPASVFTPADGNGPWPAVIFYMDGLGIRPVMWEMGQRLADGGYLVLTWNYGQTVATATRAKCEVQTVNHKTRANHPPVGSLNQGRAAAIACPSAATSKRRPR
jgi:dienelactone hydrolase